MPSAALRALTLLLVGCCCAQEWRPIDSPGAIAAYDQARGEFLSLGGNGELWSSNDLGCWQRPAPVPPAGWIMVHDPLRARTVAMTTINGSMLQTWEWDGARWRVRTSVHTPAAFSPCVVYDPQRRVPLANSRAAAAAAEVVMGVSGASVVGGSPLRWQFRRHGVAHGLAVAS